MIGADAIPWSTIDHVSVKRNELENLYPAGYFRDDTPSKKHSIKNKDKEKLTNRLKGSAAEKGLHSK